MTVTVDLRAADPMADPRDLTDPQGTDRVLLTDVVIIVLCRAADLMADPEISRVVLSVTDLRVADLWTETAEAVWVVPVLVIRIRMTTAGVHSLQSVLQSPVPTVS